MNRKKLEKQYVICVKNKGYSASLEAREIYRLISDAPAAKLNMVRVMDESGEGYLYPEEYFIPIELPQAVVKALALAA